MMHFLKSDAMIRASLFYFRCTEIMATSKPRITITLEPQEYAVLKRLSGLNGVPMSKTISELVGLVAPVLAQIADNLKTVQDSQENVRADLLRSIEKLNSRASELHKEAELVMSDLDEALTKATGADGRKRDARSRARGADGCALLPPSSNTGVSSLSEQA